MASNGNHQSERNVFSQQPKGGVAAAGDAAVRQDKGRISSAPRGTAQPAPQTKPVRPHPLNSRTVRSKNNPDPKRTTVHLVLWVNPIVKEAFQRIAKQEGTEASQGLSEQGIPLMTAQEIKQMPDEGIIGFHRQLPPFRATRMDWRHFPVLKERQAIPPPELSLLPELEETLPSLIPQSNGPLHGFINPDMTG